MARPRIEIDRAQFENLCKLQCTSLEIADWFGCSDDTISRWCKREYKKTFKEVFERYKSHGKISLRRTQLRLAESSPQMAIWLGKQWLGQTDRKEIDHTGSVPVVIHDDLPDD